MLCPLSPISLRLHIYTCEKPRESWVNKKKAQRLQRSKIEGVLVLGCSVTVPPDPLSSLRSPLSLQRANQSWNKTKHRGRAWRPRRPAPPHLSGGYRVMHAALRARSSPKDHPAQRSPLAPHPQRFSAHACGRVLRVLYRQYVPGTRHSSPTRHTH